MAGSNKSVISDPLFEEAVSIAKGFAKRNGITVIAPVLILAGVVRAIAGKETAFPALSGKIEAIKAAVSAAGIALSGAVVPISEGKMPLSVALRMAIASNRDSLEKLIDALLETVLAAATIQSGAYAEILAYASALASPKPSPIITPELLSASAYIAFSQGKFADNQALSGLLAGNQQALEALIEDAHLDRATKPRVDQPLAPLSEEILAAIRTEGTDGERLFAALNVGLKSGQRLLDQCAIAYHEAGHAVVSTVLRPALPVTKVTIVREADADGTTFYDATSPYWNKSETREGLIANLATLLAGRAAQLIKFGYGQIDIGASSDIESATAEAWRGIACCGLDADLGPVNVETIAKLQGQSSGWIFDFAQRKVQETLNEAANYTEKVLRANWAQVEAVAEKLLSKKVLSESDFAKSLVEVGLSKIPGVKSAKSRLTSRHVSFAQSPGILQTPEGRVRYDEGDAILLEGDGRTWPVSRAYFDRTYVPAEGILAGADGVYAKPIQNVLAIELTENRRLDLSRGRGILSGKTGDWIVDYGNGELSIVTGDQFLALYDVIPENNCPDISSTTEQRNRDD